MLQSGGNHAEQSQQGEDEPIRMGCLAFQGRDAASEHSGVVPVLWRELGDSCGFPCVEAVG